MKTIRTFIAIELPAEAAAALTALQQQLKAAVPPDSVRWTPARNIHLTLHFLGDIPAEAVDPLGEALRAAAGQVSPFTLSLTGLGCFPNMHRPRIVWVGVAGAVNRLTALHRDLGERLSIINYQPEARPYAPHLTIGRVKKGLPSRRMGPLSEALQQFQPRVGRLADLPVRGIHLIQSDLKPAGPIYTPLVSAALTGPADTSS
ncbi:MAG: RNA 2',3'-cyclic phosphodiesterase [Chloroflexi bacterium]|nr:MAG: RNA 2',3'-cyclic phosphodiesterase [Chloroflexota bacterium]